MEIRQNPNGDYLLKDSEGKSHIVCKDLAQQWLDTFGLKNLNQSYKPNLKDDIKNAICKDIEINSKDLLKLINKGRDKYIKNIKSTFENPQIVFYRWKRWFDFCKKAKR